MNIIETRRANLRRWIAEHGTPAKERSLFSQLKADGSFGERVARRLEEQYRMGPGYLDQDLGAAGEEFKQQQGEVIRGRAAAPEESADEMLRRVTEMIDTYRLASPTDRQRIDLAFREARSNIGAVDKSKPRTR